MGSRNTSLWPSSDNYLASFTGKQYDATGLIYFNARYYDPTIGRFITEDPLRRGTGWYSYCNNNLINKIDVTGKEPLDLNSTLIPPSINIQSPTTDEATNMMAKDADKRQDFVELHGILANVFALASGKTHSFRRYSWEISTTSVPAICLKSLMVQKL